MIEDQLFVVASYLNAKQDLFALALTNRELAARIKAIISL